MVSSSNLLQCKFLNLEINRLGGLIHNYKHKNFINYVKCIAVVAIFEIEMDSQTSIHIYNCTIGN